jgi:hypothetical protein
LVRIYLFHACYTFLPAHWFDSRNYIWQRIQIMNLVR